MDTSSPERSTAERAQAPVRSVRLGDITPQAWRNGGGRTRELLAWPTVEAWSLRISVAEIERDGPFSAYPGVRRWFAVIDGAGVTLAFDAGERVCRRGDAPLAFDGSDAPACRLLDGPTRDLNLMARHGRSTLRAVRADVPWDEAFTWRGLYAAVAGRWHDGVGSRAVDAGTLLWTDAIDTNGLGAGRDGVVGVGVGVGVGAAGRGQDRVHPDDRASRPAAAWRFVPNGAAAGDAASAWWLGYTPDPESPR